MIIITEIAEHDEMCLCLWQATPSQAEEAITLNSMLDNHVAVDYCQHTPHRSRHASYRVECVTSGDTGVIVEGRLDTRDALELLVALRQEALAHGLIDNDTTNPDDQQKEGEGAKS